MLNEKNSDWWVFIKCVHGMYGLPQSGSVGHYLLKKQLNKAGYFQSKIINGFWKHQTWNLRLVFVVDKFGIKYIRKDDLDHFIDILCKYYDVKVDLEWRKFIKIKLD